MQDFLCFCSLVTAYVSQKLAPMKPNKSILLGLATITTLVTITFSSCIGFLNAEKKLINELERVGLVAQVISAENFYLGIAPEHFESLAGATYKPSHNEEPEIPAQCWIETGYGTQNACKYCHTDFLAEIKHGNAYPIADDQEVYSFPTANLNKILWQNIIYPQNIEQRLIADGITIPELDAVEYVRVDNWKPVFEKARGNGNLDWVNTQSDHANFILFPSLNPNHLFPYKSDNPTNSGANGYIDEEGFIKNEQDAHTGWRAVNFFPYTLFTPLTGSVSGIYIKLSKEFMQKDGGFDLETYKKNLAILEKNIKNQNPEEAHYMGDASTVRVHKGFYPMGTEFAHPLHYVDLNADGESGIRVDGVVASNGNAQYEFPGTRSKRVKEIRYMYKWKEVNLKDIEEKDSDKEFNTYIGAEGKGWIDNGAGWIIAAYIENRHGELRPQTTEELAQCLGCHAKVGTTVDAIWSFQRKLPGLEGWADMNYGHYSSSTPEKTRLNDYLNQRAHMGEMGYFYHSVVGAELYGVMREEVRRELTRFAHSNRIELPFSVETILDDNALKLMDKEERMPILLARQALMRQYSQSLEYLQYCERDDQYYIKGSIFYPLPQTMQANIQGYRKIVLDQSFNLGKDVFGTSEDHVPFTLRSDGTVLDENGNIIPAGNVIYSRQYDEEGEGITPTGIIEGDVFNRLGNKLNAYTQEDELKGMVIFTGTLDRYYNPIISEQAIRKSLVQ